MITFSCFQSQERCFLNIVLEDSFTCRMVSIFSLTVLFLITNFQTFESAPLKGKLLLNIINLPLKSFGMYINTNILFYIKNYTTYYI